MLKPDQVYCVRYLHINSTYIHIYIYTKYNAAMHNTYDGEIYTIGIYI